MFNLIAGICLLLIPTSVEPTTADNDWPRTNNDAAGTRYSTLTQINKTNVSKLKVAWTYHTGDADREGNRTTIECTPVMVEGNLYITTVRGTLISLAPNNGSVIWQYYPRKSRYSVAVSVSGGVNRGIAYWSDGKPAGERRVILGTADGQIISINTKTGNPDPEFGR